MPLNHVALTVRDREESAAFYSRHLGLSERLHDDEHLLILRSPDGSLVAIDRASRRWAIAQALRQLDAAEEAYARVYPGT